MFLDQLGSTGIVTGSNSAGNKPDFNNRFFFDAGAGANLVTGDFMIGASAQHLNRPNESLTGGNSIVPIRFNGYPSYKITLNNYVEDSPVLILPSFSIPKAAQIPSAPERNTKRTSSIPASGTAVPLSKTARSSYPSSSIFSAVKPMIRPASASVTTSPQPASATAKLPEPRKAPSATKPPFRARASTTTGTMTAIMLQLLLRLF